MRPKLFGYRRFKITRGHKKKDKYTKKRPPVKKGRIYTIHITDISDKGDGFGKIQKFAVFVPGAKIGETLEIKIVEVKKNCAVGKIMEKEEI
ncbi:MAG: TRAM domain-containing protein [Candidatus Aenigmatarchaeota archaeon]